MHFTRYLQYFTSLLALFYTLLAYVEKITDNFVMCNPNDQNTMRLLFFVIPFLFFISCSTPKLVLLDSGLKYTILKKGKGSVAEAGNEVLIHEKMSYPNDSLLFSSYKQTGPIKFRVGGNQVIDGVDQGVRGMKKGEIRKLIVPPSLSKRMGNQTFPHPDSTLIYQVELVDILLKK